MLYISNTFSFVVKVFVSPFNVDVSKNDVPVVGTVNCLGALPGIWYEDVLSPVL